MREEITKQNWKKERWSNDNVVYYSCYLAVNKRYSNFDCRRDVVRKRFLAPSLVLLRGRLRPYWSLLGVYFKFSDQNPRPFHIGVNPSLSSPGWRYEWQLTLYRISIAMYNNIALLLIQYTSICCNKSTLEVFFERTARMLKLFYAFQFFKKRLYCWYTERIRCEIEKNESNKQCKKRKIMLSACKVYLQVLGS